MRNYGVLKFQAPFERLKEYDYTPEVRLYKAILTQAIIDVSNIADIQNAKKIELEAKAWIFGNSKYFQEVCCKAEIEPNFVIKIAREAIRLNLLGKTRFRGQKLEKIFREGQSKMFTDSVA